MLIIDRVTFHYPESMVEANFEVQSGQAMALMGPSGCGKTTTLDLIAGFRAPEAGDIRWNETSLLASPPASRPLSYLFQQHNLFPHLNVWQNVAIGIHPGMKISKFEEEQIAESLHSVGLSGYEKRRSDQLSGGQQQRVGLARGLARSLLCDKPILLLDEPFSALDQTIRDQIIELINDLRDNHALTLLISTHQLDDAKALNADVYRFDSPLNPKP